jgi:hypothetical protein
MQQNTLKNVGLYGNLPTMQSAGGRGGGDKRAGDGRRTDGAVLADRRTASTIDAKEGARAIGNYELVVPAQYRRRVAEYFQRIADENAER